MTLPIRKGIVLAALAGVCVCGLEAAEQKTFKTPIAAAQALVAAAQKGAREEVVAILGEAVREALSTGNPAQDQVEKAVILRLAHESTVVKPDEENSDRSIVYF